VDVTREIRINNKAGLNLHLASEIARAASGFDCEITIANNGHTANGKEVAELMGMDAPCGSTVTVHASGPSVQQALDSLEKIISSEIE